MMKHKMVRIDDHDYDLKFIVGGDYKVGDTIIIMLKPYMYFIAFADCHGI